jgi:transposase
MKTHKEPWRKKSYEKLTLELKLFVVDQIQNGQIPTSFASKKQDLQELRFPIGLENIVL